MRSDLPDYTTPVVAYFRGLVAWVITAVIGGVLLYLAHHQFRFSVWVSRGLFVAWALAGVANAAIFMRAFVREEHRVRHAAGAQRSWLTPPATPSACVIALRLLAFVGAVCGLPVLIAGLIAKLAVMAAIGGVLFAVTLLDVGLINPVLQARRSHRTHQ